VNLLVPSQLKNRSCANSRTALQRTTLGRKHSINLEATSRKLFLSTEFTKTVKAPSDQSLDQFQRPVSWVLWSSVCEKAVIVIPEEAEVRQLEADVMSLVFLIRSTALGTYALAPKFSFSKNQKTKEDVWLIFANSFLFR
jgi:hypothetical protein